MFVPTLYIVEPSSGATHFHPDKSHEREVIEKMATLQIFLKLGNNHYLLNIILTQKCGIWSRPIFRDIPKVTVFWSILATLSIWLKIRK